LEAEMSEACGQEFRDLFTSTPVEQLAISTRPTLSPDDSIADAVAEMRIHSHGSAVICDAGRLVGIFTERDMLRVLADQMDLEQPVSSVMTSAPHTLQAGSTLSDVISSMYRGGYRRLPVVDQAEHPVGIIDVKAVVQFLVEHFPEAVYNQASRVHSIARHREGA
jgi:CBS domain-containing protein